MKNLFILMAMGMIVVFMLVFSGHSAFAAIPHLINYQGMLTDNSGNPLSGPFNLTFKIWTDTTGGSSLWTETQNGVQVQNGLFNVILGRVNALNLAFDQQYWLEVGVGAETMPRIRFTSVGYAYRADTAGYALAGPWGGNNTWIFLISDGADTTLRTGGRWGITRYGNVLYGNADSTHTNFGVACTTGTSGENMKYCTVGGGYLNIASRLNSTVGGGYLNFAWGTSATVAGGSGNSASGQNAAIGGGGSNQATSFYTAIGGGYINLASGSEATIGGGFLNKAQGVCATVGGGNTNTASGSHSSIAGGDSNLAAGDYSAILGGHVDTITSTGDYSYLFGIKSKLTQDSTFMVDMPHIRFGKESGGYEFPTSDGTNGQVMATNGSGKLSWVSPGGGGVNYWTFLISDGADTILRTGGRWGIARYGNVLWGTADSTHVNFGVVCTTGTSGQNYKYCTVGGGYRNKASAASATIAGGQNNIASGSNAAVGGGWRNTASGTFYATVGGGQSNTASGTNSTVGGGASNCASGEEATVAGGGGDTASAPYATAGGGEYNIASALCATVAGGVRNTASGQFSIVAGGYYNLAAGDYSAILGGYADTITSTADYSYLFGIKGKLTDDSTFMVAMPYSRFDGDVQLNKNGGVLTLRTPTHDDASRYGIYFANNDLAPFMGDDGQDQDFDFYTGFASNRSYDAHVKVFGSASGSWGNYIELTHDGADGFIKTDVGDICLLPAGNVGIGTNIVAEKLDVNGKVYIETMDATSSGSLVRWYNKRLCSDASSARYKEDIQPLEDDFSKILQVQPKSFVDKTSGERNIGFIAEEFETLNLKNLVIHRDGQPEGIKYELVSLYLLEVVKELKTKNEELQRRIEALESK